jgi:hypothetical protein
MVDRTVKKDVCIDEKGRVIMSTPDADKPNPSIIIAEAIDRAIANATAIQVARFDATHTRVDGVEKAVEVFQADLTRVPTQLDRAINGQSAVINAQFDAIGKDIARIYSDLGKRGSDISEAITHLRELMEGKVQELSSVTMERFAGVAAQFSERDTRTDQRAGDTKLAVDAAFAAAKEATAKIEAGFTKQIDGMVTIIDTKTGNLAGGLGDLKERMTAMEARTQGLTSGRQEVRVENQDNRGFILGISGTVIALSAIVLTVIIHFVK